MCSRKRHGLQISECLNTYYSSNFESSHRALTLCEYSEDQEKFQKVIRFNVISSFLYKNSTKQFLLHIFYFNNAVTCSKFIHLTLWFVQVTWQNHISFSSMMLLYRIPLFLFNRMACMIQIKLT